MQLSRSRSSSGGSSEISFPGLESWNPLTKVATIAAEVNKTRALCRVSLDTLQRAYGVSKQEPMDAVAQHRGAIHDAARRLMESNAYEEDGSVVISFKDLAP